MGLPFFGIVVRRVCQGDWVEDIRLLFGCWARERGVVKGWGARGRVEKMPEAAAKGVVWWCGVVLAGGG